MSKGLTFLSRSTSRIFQSHEIPVLGFQNLNIGVCPTCPPAHCSSSSKKRKTGRCERPRSRTRSRQRRRDPDLHLRPIRERGLSRFDNTWGFPISNGLGIRDVTLIQPW